MSKRGLPVGVQMRHDSHYVDTLAAPVRTIGRKISIDLVEPNPEQPRSEFGDLHELSESIKEKGVLEPLLVRPNPDAGTWMIIAGERRWRASKLAGLTEVPCIEMDLDDQGVAEIALIENLQRKDLNVWEEADGLASLAAKFGYTQEQIAQKISKSRSTVTEFMTIAGLPQEIRERCEKANVVNKSALLEVARQFDEAAMHERLDLLTGGKKSSSLTKRPKSQVDATSVTHSSENLISANKGIFRYGSKEGEFELVLKFGSNGALDKRNVLKALKEAFDSVKGNETAI